MVFRNAVPLLRGRPSLEDMLDSGLFVMDDKDERNVLAGTNNSKEKADIPPQQMFFKSRAEIKKVYHDTTNEMHQFPTFLLHWDNLVVTDRGNTKKANLFEDNQQKENSDKNRQQQQQQEVKRQSQMEQPHDEYDTGKYDDPNVMSSMLSDGSNTAPRSSQQGTRQRKDQTSNNKTEVSDSSNSTSALRQQQNNTLNFEALLAPTTNQHRQEHYSTETIVVLPEGPMLRGGRNINSELLDSMYFGTLVTERYESHGDTDHIMDARPGLSISGCFPVVSLMILLSFVALWSKARPSRAIP
jgi:hypothetical protein